MSTAERRLKAICPKCGRLMCTSNSSEYFHCCYACKSRLRIGVLLWKDLIEAAVTLLPEAIKGPKIPDMSPQRWTIEGKTGFFMRASVTKVTIVELERRLVFDEADSVTLASVKDRVLTFVKWEEKS